MNIMNLIEIVLMKLIENKAKRKQHSVVLSKKKKIKSMKGIRNWKMEIKILEFRN